VRLTPATDTLMIGEGLETCLAGMQAKELPAWAALSAGGIEGLILPPPSLAATVVILADNDANGRGERAARTVAQRWLAEGRRVRIAMPPEPGTDFADVLAGYTHAGITEVRDVAA
jgi:putative DNA primase/helicase